MYDPDGPHPLSSLEAAHTYEEKLAAVRHTGCLRPVGKRRLDSACEGLPLRPCSTFKLSLQQQQPDPVSSTPVPQAAARVAGRTPQCQRSRWIAQSEPKFQRQPHSHCQASAISLGPLANREPPFVETGGRPHPWLPALGLPTLGYLRVLQAEPNPQPPQALPRA